MMMSLVVAFDGFLFACLCCLWLITAVGILACDWFVTVMLWWVDVLIVCLLVCGWLRGLLRCGVLY